MKNEEALDISNFNFVVSYKRSEVSAAGVAIYHNTVHSSYIEIHTNFTRGVGVNFSNIGEICVTHCNSESGQYILVVPFAFRLENP